MRALEQTGEDIHGANARRRDMFSIGSTMERLVHRFETDCMSNSTLMTSSPLLGTVQQTLLLTAAVGTGVVAGVFFAFSVFVMKALHALPPEQGMRAMQSINTAAPAPLFVLLLFGTGLCCLVIAVAAVRDLSAPGNALRLAGAVLYLLCVVGLTVAYHVPHNDTLAALDPTSTEGLHYWASYVVDWTRLNHVRTCGSLAAAIAFTLALRTPA